MPPLDRAALGPAFAALDRRLESRTTMPLAVAVSGGGDSLALLRLAAEWIAPHGRSLLVLHVDHQLQARSPQWADHVEAAARAVGARFQRLAWTGEKPRTGLSAAARGARHRLLAQAAREAGARVILLGHTADDLEEARLMRDEGSNVSQPREWSPSPVWPEGRDTFLLRPLLAVRRRTLRDLLAARGVRWIDDPANEDPRSARARARLALAQTPLTELSAAKTQDFRSWSGAAWGEAHGALTISRARARAAPGSEIAAACLCAAGGERPPRADQVAALAARLTGETDFVATLAGARIEAGPKSVLFCREAGEAVRSPPVRLNLKARETAVWDGRFEVTAARDLTLHPIAGLAARLDAPQKKSLANLPAAVRRSLPAAIDEHEKVSCIVLPGGAGRARSLAWPRMAAFCGAVEREAALPILGGDIPSHSEKACG